ncbi:MAG: VIT domain-containing protein [Planctomycetota bacterium]|nr:VIT domain-containing protein [Planctomycetota bacterium]
MSRSLPLFLAALLLLSLGVVAPEAGANGILVTADATAPTPPIEHHRRRPPVRPHRPAVTLKGHTVKVKIEDRIAVVTVEQVFQSHSHRQLEGTYLFPLPEGATVSDFSMTMFGKMVKGEVVEADKAREIYQSIVSRRRDPGLLEYMGRGLFRARVFPILPKKDLTIRIRYQQVLPEDGGTVELRYPLGTDRMNATPVESAVIDVQVESREEIKGIYSPSHNVEIKRDGDHKARVSYERAGRRQDRDFLLYVNRAEGALGFSLQSHKAVAEDGTFMAVLSPRVKIDPKDRLPKDIVYVLDTSGSMVDKKIEQARNALKYGIGMLRENDRFNVIGFGSSVHPFRDNLLDVTRETKDAATKWVDALEARGGTNIEDALKTALRMRKSDDRLFMVVFLTDGRPTIGTRNGDKLVKLVKQANTANTRVFTFGVGYDLDVNLLDRIAEVTKGTRDYVMPEEDIEIATGRFFRKVDSPVLTDVSLELGEGVYDVYPKKIGDLFAGGQIVVFGRYRNAGDRVFRVKGKVRGKEVVFDYESTLQRGEGAEYLPRLWAHKKIAFLLDEIRLHGQSKEVVDEIIQLATKYAIVTPYTAGLVVEESELGGRTVREQIEQMRRRADRGEAGRPADLPSLGGIRDGLARLGGGKPRAGAAPAPASPALPTPRTPSSGPMAEADKREVAKDSERLKKMKSGAASGEDADDEAQDAGVELVKSVFKRVSDKTFIKDPEGRWLEKGFDRKKATTKVEAYSATYFELLAKDKKVAKYLALGERVVFELKGTWYEIVPAK